MEEERGMKWCERGERKWMEWCKSGGGGGESEREEEEEGSIVRSFSFGSGALIRNGMGSLSREGTARLLVFCKVKGHTNYHSLPI